MLKQKCLLIMLLLNLFFAKEVYSTGFSGQEPLSIPQTEEVLNQEPVSLELISSEEKIEGGKPFTLLLRMNHDKGWHSYWKNPGSAGIATEINWDLPEGFTSDALTWPTPAKFEEYGIIGYGYEDEAFFAATLTPPANLPNEPFEIKANITWTACSDTTCLPGEKEVSLKLNDSKASSFENKQLVDKVKKSFPLEIQAKGAYKNEEWIQLELKDLENLPKQEYELAFFPLKDKTVDETSSALLVPKETDGEFSLLIKRHADNEPCELLEGLVLFPKGSELNSLAINAKLAKGEKPLLSFLDKRQATKKATLMEEEPNFNFEGGFLLYLLMAFVGGLILNLMPCVLPVVSFKILSFVKLAGENRALTAKHGLAFSFGVLVSFWVLAGALLLFQAYGKAIGWGFQLQEPLFVAGLIMVIFIFSLSLLGVFEAGTLVSAWAGSNVQKSKGSSQNVMGSFFSGVLATAVATPCTGPFLGPAVGFAVQEPPLFAILIFTALGLGMALPYLVLSFFPQFMRFLPKPGPWMVVFKEMTGFIMLATVIWLLWVFTAETSSEALILLIFSLFIVAFGCWIFGKWGTPVKSKRTRLISLGLFTLLLIGSFKMGATASNIIENPTGQHHTSKRWESFSKARVNELVAEGKPVFIDFTARWCLICQANHFVLSQETVDEAFKRKGVTLMKADWTRHDPEITQELARYGRNGVPLYLFYSGKKGAPPVILPQVLTPEIVLDHIELSSTISENG